MARPTVIENETILNAARAVFLERGLQSTSAEVARRAGISEGSVFKRYKTTPGLFEAAVAPEINDLLQQLSRLPGQAGSGNVLDNLVGAGELLLRVLRRLTPLFMMRLAGTPELASRTMQLAAREQMLLYLTDYLKNEGALGRIDGALDTATVAQAFLGALSSQVGLESPAIASSPEAEHHAARYVRELVRVLLEGMLRSAA
jgi:AcrR family transcriptional regulator